jgi:hypothetical protein
MVVDWLRWIPWFRSQPLKLCDEAEDVYNWLIERDYARLPSHEYIGPIKPWADVVRAELRRRNWLSTWGLSVKDVPDDCSPDNPWLRGFDPVSVRRRRDDLEIADKVNEIVESVRISRGRNPR